MFDGFDIAALLDAAPLGQFLLQRDADDQLLLLAISPLPEFELPPAQPSYRGKKLGPLSFDQLRW
jgi:hypothetical protein